MSTLRTDTLVLGAQVNDVLGLADELRDAVRILKAKREAIRARVAAALPVESSGATSPVMRRSTDFRTLWTACFNPCPPSI